MFCNNCGKEIDPNQAFCPNCGAPIANNAAPNMNAPQYNNVVNDPTKSDKDWLVALLLCIFVGGLGIHRFYVGKTGTGILWLLTAGCFGIGTLVDLIQIVMGNFTDINGKAVKR